MRASILLTVAILFTACGNNKTTTDEQKDINNKPKKEAKVYADSAQYYWQAALANDSMMVDSALYMIDMAIEADTSNPVHKYIKAGFLSQMGNYSDALDIYKKIDAKSQVDYSTYNMMGMLYYRLGDMESSKKYFELGHQSVLAKIDASENPSEIVHLRMLDAILIIMEGEKDKAITMLENIIPANETEAKYLNQQIAELRTKTKEDLVEDMLPLDRGYMFERNKKVMEQDSALIQ